MSATSRSGALANGERPALQSVTIALDIIDALADSRELGLSELARRVGIAKSTAHRTCSVLVGRGLLRRTPAGTYQLGLRFVEYGQLATARSAVGDRALPMLVELRNALGETVQIGVPDGGDVVYVERVEGVHALRYIDGNPGAIRAPFERWQGAGRLHPRSARGPPACRFPTEHGLHDRGARRVRQELATICKRGTPAASTRPSSGCPRWPCRSAPTSRLLVVAALSLVGPTARIAGSAESCHVATLTAGARQLTVSLASGEYRLSSLRRR